MNESFVPHLSVTTGFLIGVFLSIILLIIFWAIGTASLPVANAYRGMLCDYIVIQNKND